MAKTNVRRKERPTRTVTHNAAPAWRLTAREELALTAVSTLSGERTYYETAEQRTERLLDLVRTVTAKDPGFVQLLVARLRNEYNLRSVPLDIALEYLHAGGPRARSTISAALQRADEPAEAISLWRARYGHSLPWALRQGVSDAVADLYTERSAIKYGRNRNAAYQMADVIELVHPRPPDAQQAELFKYLLDERHHGDGMADVAQEASLLGTTWAHRNLGQIPLGDRRGYLLEHGTDALFRAGYPWESLSGWIGGPMDAEVWETVIPRMGLLALLRNLRNFDQAGIGVGAQREVERKLLSPEDVEGSRIFPHQVWAAYREAPSDRWKHPLATTFELSTANVPAMDRTLFLVDVSGSMSQTLSTKGSIQRSEVASVMAVAAQRHSKDVSIVPFAAESTAWTPRPGQSELGQVQDLLAVNGERHGGFGYTQSPLGHATYGHNAIARWFRPAEHDRVVIFTDDQMNDDARLSAHVPTIVYWNLAGYRPHSDWGKGRYHVGGFSDAAFRTVAELTS